MKQKLMILLVVVLALMGIYCGYRYYNDAYLPNKHITNADKEQRELFESIKPDFPDPEPFEDNVSEETVSEAESDEPEIDYLADLRAENTEVVGWITVPGTGIDYPIAQAADNDFYLHNGFDRAYNYDLGCPFLDYRCKGDFSGFNSIVYAHHIKGKQAMFAEIANFTSKSFMEQNPTALLLTKDGTHTVRFFAYITVPRKSFAYDTEFDKRTDKETYIDELFKNANYTLGMTAEDLKKEKSPHILLLSTCTYEYWEARGVLIGVIE